VTGSAIIPDSPLGRQYVAILGGLRKLQSSADPAKVFGATTHQFRLNAPLDERTVSAFEAEHRVQLPEDYRGFLLHVGDGGAGPAYGVFRLGQMDDEQWKENNDFVGVLSLPFPHTLRWNDLTGKPEFDESQEANEGYEDAYGELMQAWQDEHYWNTRHINGAIPICHLGCALRDWLVITGPEAGHVWCDNRVDEKGLSPAETGTKERVTFVEWYLAWLDDALKTLSVI